MGGGTVLRAITGGVIPYEIGGAIVSAVVTAYVFLGGMRGTAWVNALQTTLFLLFGTIAAVVIGNGMGGFREAMETLIASPATSPLLTRERVSPWYFFSYTFIPLSSIAFPHICIFCLTARNVTYFRKTIVLYPICMLFIWLPSVFLVWLRITPQRCRPSRRSSKLTRAATPNAGLTPDDQAAARRAGDGCDFTAVGEDTRGSGWPPAGAAVMAPSWRATRRFSPCRRVHRDIFAFYRAGTLWPRHAGDDGPVIRRAGHSRGVRHSAAHPQSIFDVATCAFAVTPRSSTADRRTVLEGQHPLGCARHHALDGDRRRRCGGNTELHSSSAGCGLVTGRSERHHAGQQVVRHGSAAGRADDADLGMVMIDKCRWRRRTSAFEQTLRRLPTGKCSGE
jgi:hypothetical protein